MASTVLIGCRLPNGLVIQHPLNKKLKVTLAGLNSSKIIGATHVMTEVDAEFWSTWKTVHEKDFKPYTSGAIFEGKNEADVKAKAKELKGEKTGLEQLQPESHGVKPADKK